MKTKFFVLTAVLVLATVASTQQGPAPKPLRVRVSSGVADGLLIHKVNPEYPSEARAQHVQGDVVLQAVIDKSGNISEIKVVSGDPLLTGAAVKAIKQWKYRPFLLNGEPVEVETTIPIKFHMG
jgi:protein TonB